VVAGAASACPWAFDDHEEDCMADQTGALSRRRLLGAGAIVGATALATTARPADARSAPDAVPAGVAPDGAATAGVAPDGAAAAGLAPAATPESRSYPGITLMAGNELTVATSTVFVKDPFNGSYPNVPNGYVGTALDVPAGSVVHDVVFFLYQQAGGVQQLCAVQLYHPGGPGYEILLSHVATEAGIVAVSTAALGGGTLPRVVTADDALCAFVWRGQQNAVCRGIRVDYTPPGLVGGAAGGGLVAVPPSRVYDSRQSGGKLHDGEQRGVSLATALDGAPVVPLGASAAAVTLTVTGTEGPGGYVAVFPSGGAWSGTSSVNWFGPGQNLATTTIVALGPNRDVTLLGGANTTDVIVDVTAYVS
jgi:hypothetical protein